jgi:serine/threonine-protein kinase RsbW
MNERSIRLPDATMSDLARMKRFIVDSSVELGAELDLATEINVAAEEAITNILLHGYEEEPGLIWLTIKKDSTDLHIHIRDQGPAFDPTGFPQPNVQMPLESRPYGGMGIHMMRSFADKMVYQKTADGMNELIITKHNAVSLQADG